MLSKSIYHYYWFGTCVRYLQDTQAGALVGESDGPYVLFNLTEFFDRLDELALHVARRAAGDLIGFYESLKDRDANDRLTAGQATELRGLMRDLRQTVEAELQGIRSIRRYA